MQGPTPDPTPGGWRYDGPTPGGYHWPDAVLGIGLFLVCEDCGGMVHPPNHLDHTVWHQSHPTP